MCHHCISQPSQDIVLKRIVDAWDGVCLYDTLNDEYEVLAVGHKGSEYLFALVDSLGNRRDVNDATNQLHWLQDVHSGRLPLLWSPEDGIEDGVRV